MANNTTLKTQIKLRRATAGEWRTSDPVLGEGEPGYETDTHKLKIGDSKTSWNNLPYITDIIDLSTVTNKVIVVINKSGAAVTNPTGFLGKGTVTGDIGIIKTEIADDKYSYTAYVWNGGEWYAMDGNYSAENVYTSKDMKLAGEYTDGIGNYEKGTIINAGTSIQDILSKMFSKRLQPKASNPSATIAFVDEAGVATDISLEIGTRYQAKYVISYSDGKFQPPGGAVQNAGCKSTDSTVKFDGKPVTINGEQVTISGEKLNGAKGTIDEITIDSENKKIFELTYGWESSANAAKDNFGDNAEPSLTIGAASNQTAFSIHGVSGYRCAFGGSSTGSISTTSDGIRDLQISVPSSYNSFQVPVVEGAKAVLIAVPATRQVTKIEDKNALGTNIFAAFSTRRTTEVEGKNNFDAIPYNYYLYTPATSLSENIYTVHLANA